MSASTQVEEEPAAHGGTDEDEDDEQELVLGHTDLGLGRIGPGRWNTDAGAHQGSGLTAGSARHPLPRRKAA